MKTPEEMAEYFRSMPKKEVAPNPYWIFAEDPVSIRSTLDGETPLDLKGSNATLKMVRNFFRRFFESFRTEAQVLCVTPEDAGKLSAIGIPVLGQGQIGPFKVSVVVLPQDNHMGTSVISEWGWQQWIVMGGIKPVARIHSHHILDPYQSATDYSTLNSGTLEIVIGKIFEEDLHICYWLDVPGTDIKAQTFLAQEGLDGGFMWVSRRFNGPGKENMEPAKGDAVE